MITRKTCLWAGAVMLALLGCGKKAPPAIQTEVDAQRAATVKVATDAAAHCAELHARVPLPADPSKAKPMPANPAKGSPLESAAKVHDVLIMCTRGATSGTPGTSEGTGFGSLKGKDTVPKLKVTMPEDKLASTCKDGGDTSCEWLVVPSRYLDTSTSADFHVRRPAPEGFVEVTTVLETK